MIMDYYYYFHYLMIIIIINSLSVFCQKQSQREYRELITEQVIFLPKYYQVFNHTDLPVVKNELSITLKINILQHEDNDYYHTIFYKGNTFDNQTPSLWLKETEPVPFIRCSTNSNSATGFELVDYEFRTTQWYHIAYTLSDPDKRINLYIDGKWVGSYSLTIIQNEFIIFNDEPLYIGKNPNFVYNDGVFGLISNFRYYNFRLSHEEVLKDYSGEDPTIINDDDSGTTSNFILVIVSYFLGMITLAGGYILRKSIIRGQFQIIN
ncbi:concanavalin A-like lectin/glucanase domain-containing protein [Rhizophagus diaphanus]|nr:concanavalin A-like lectin/glucanase domain-containing protein [Rhizophagus diaphanus] [Rhizophagus sp. MUCL 43196]